MAIFIKETFKKDYKMDMEFIITILVNFMWGILLIQKSMGQVYYYQINFQLIYHKNNNKSQKFNNIIMVNSIKAINLDMEY